MSSNVNDDRPRHPCPMCAELILVEAKKCRFCGELLVPDGEKLVPDGKSTLSPDGRPKPRGWDGCIWRTCLTCSETTPTWERHKTFRCWQCQQVNEAGGGQVQKGTPPGPARSVSPPAQPSAAMPTAGIPRCPVCSSSDLRRISTSERVVSGVAGGLLFSKKARSQFQCLTCQHTF